MASVTIIAAAALNGAIGRDNALLWHLREDMRFFRAATLGHCVVMGRKTYESMGSRPLPGRLNIVISRGNPAVQEGVVAVHSLQEALDAAGSAEVFIIGGGQIYREAMAVADTILLTRVFLEPSDADTFFPVIDASCWRLEKAESPVRDEASGIEFRFEKYVRI